LRKPVKVKCGISRPLQRVLIMKIQLKKLTKVNCEVHFAFTNKKKKDWPYSINDGKFLSTTYVIRHGSSFELLDECDVLIVGVDDYTEMTPVKAEKIGKTIYNSLQEHKVTGNVNIHIDDELRWQSIKKAQPAINIAFGIQQAEYKFDKYFTKKDDDDTVFNIGFDYNSTSKTKDDKDFKKAMTLVDSINFAKDLISEPSNVIYPDSYAKLVQKKFKPLGIKVTVLGEAQLKTLKMNALLAVGQGSERESKVVIMEYTGAKKSEPIALVGKGVTFDTGGYSIKPAKGMGEMKYDMAGSAVVVGTMMALALRKAKVNAIGIIGLVENMVSHNAYKPGDVLVSMSGQTIEVDNTDAEGRVVLADILHYAQTKYKPQAMVDLATLTGAVLVILGSELAGLFSNDDTLSEQLIDCGKEVEEEVWRLPCDPIGERFDKMIDSTIADMKNTGSGGPGSTTAAQFLQRFVGDTPWAHLDIAGVTWDGKNGGMVSAGGATGWGIKLLNQWTQHYEEQ